MPCSPLVSCTTLKLCIRYYLNLKTPGHALFTNLKKRVVVVDELAPYLVEHKTGPPLSSLKEARETTKVQALPCSQSFCQIAKD
jgi:hypothetical protein